MSNLRFIFSLIILPVLFFGCAREETNESKNETEILEPITVVTKKIEPGLITNFQTTGEVQASQATMLTAPYRAEVQKIFTQVGQITQANDLILQLSSADLQAAVETAETNKLNAQSSLEQTELMNQKNIATAVINLETAKLNLTNIQTQNEVALQQAQENLIATEVNSDLAILNAQTNLENAMRLALPNVQQTLNMSDELLGMTDTYAANNDVFEELLGALDRATKWSAEKNFQNLWEKFATEPATYPEVAELLDLAVVLLQDILNLLNNTPTGTSFPQTALNSNMQNFVNQLAQVQSVIVNLEASQAALQSAYQTNAEGEAQNLKIAEVNFAANQTQLDLAEKTAALAVESAQAALEAAQEAADLSALNVKASLDNSQKQLQQVRINLAKLAVTAPFAGVVRKILVESGEEVNPGTPLVELASEQDLKIVAEVPQEVILGLTVGQEIKIKENLIGTLAIIAPAANPATQKFPLEITLPDSDLKAGEFITLDFKFVPDLAENKIFVPITAIQILSEEAFVWLAEDNKTQKAVVQLGEIVGDMVEIKEGLELGAELIVEGMRILESTEDGREIIRR